MKKTLPLGCPEITVRDADIYMIGFRLLSLRKKTAISPR